MADHVREQIAAALVTALTGLTTTGARVYRDRDTEANPLQADELPALTIDDDGEGSEAISISGALQDRALRLSGAAHVKALTGYKTLLNVILKEVEIAVSGTSFLSGKAHVTLTEIGPREVSEAADRPIVRQSFVFNARYFTAPSAPDTPL